MEPTTEASQPAFPNSDNLVCRLRLSPFPVSESPVEQGLDYTLQVTNPSKRDSAVRKVVRAARAILSGQIGFAVGCQRLDRALYWLSPYETDLPAITHEYLKAVTGLPIGSERLLWERDALKEKDAVPEPINQKFRQKFRGRILETCWVLLDRFER